MRTPRPMGRPGITTLVGNGSLPDPPPSERWPREWDVRGKALLRKCMFLPAPPHLQAMMSAQPESVRNPKRLPPPAPRREVPLPEVRRSPERFARAFPAVLRPQTPRPGDTTGTRARAALLAREKAKLLAPDAGPRWYEDPVIVGTLLLALPPIGLAALWSSKRYSSDARWALTVMTGLTMCLVAAITITVVIIRH